MITQLFYKKLSAVLSVTCATFCAVCLLASITTYKNESQRDDFYFVRLESDLTFCQSSLDTYDSSDSKTLVPIIRDLSRLHCRLDDGVHFIEPDLYYGALVDFGDIANRISYYVMESDTVDKKMQYLIESVHQSVDDMIKALSSAETTQAKMESLSEELNSFCERWSPTNDAADAPYQYMYELNDMH